MRHELYRLQTQWGSAVSETAGSWEDHKRRQEKLTANGEADETLGQEKGDAFGGKVKDKRPLEPGGGVGVGSGRQEIAEDSQGLCSDGTYDMSCCEGNVKYCLSNTQQGWRTGDGKARSSCDTPATPRVWDELRKMTRDCAWITSQAPSTHGASFHLTPSHTTTALVHWKRWLQEVKSGPQETFGKGRAGAERLQRLGLNQALVESAY